MGWFVSLQRAAGCKEECNANDVLLGFLLLTQESAKICIFVLQHFFMSPSNPECCKSHYDQDKITTEAVREC